MSARTIHPFPARMAPEIALDAIPQATESSLTVLDPMCGSGTVLHAAASRGHHTVGVDIDPLAIMMSDVATMTIDAEELLDEARLVSERAVLSAGACPWMDDETLRFIDYWFDAPQQRSLVALTSAISEVESKDVMIALRVALSRTIITKSPQASLAADTSHSRPHRVIDSSDYDVASGFMKSVRALARLKSKQSPIARPRLHRGDSRELEGIDSASVDLVVTSPPYLNALDYMRGHKFALVWFGHTIRELRELRGTSIGAERSLSIDPDGPVSEIVRFIKSDVGTADALPMGVIQRFAYDMSGFARAMRRVIRPGGEIVTVVGNSTLRGNYIRNDMIVQKALEQEGFSVQSRYEREIPASSRYLAINTSSASLTSRMRSEVVLKMG